MFEQLVKVTIAETMNSVAIALIVDTCFILVCFIVSNSIVLFLNGGKPIVVEMLRSPRIFKMFIAILFIENYRGTDDCFCALLNWLLAIRTETRILLNRLTEGYY